MSKANDYRRDSTRSVRVARENLQYLLALARQQPEPERDIEVIDTLLLIIEYVDKLDTDATVRNHNIDELLISASRLRRQRDQALDAEQEMRRWMEQFKTELDNYRAQYPNSTPPPPVRPASDTPAPPEYFQQTFPFMERPNTHNNTLAKK